jgi:CHAT domain-containing protein
MRALRLVCLPILLIPAALAGCARPPATAYVAATAGTASAQPVGKNAAGEACTQQALATAAGQSVDIYCGSWQQPSATVRQEAALAPSGLAAAAQSGAWRSALDARFTCAAPAPTSILGGQPAVAMQCSRKVGGWPQVALVAEVGNATYYADGVLPALPVIERAIGLLSGRMTAAQAASGETAAEQSGADALIASRLAAQSFSSGDVGQFETLVQAGTRADLAENFAAAEQAFRAALALQQKALGRDDPNIVTPLTYLALQVSNEGRYAEANALFAQADRLVAHAADPSAAPRLLHYEALSAWNQRQNAAALALLQRAQAAYAALVPPQALAARPRVQLARAGQLEDLLPAQDLVVDPSSQSALLGLVEVQRYRAMVLREMGDTAESDAAIATAERLAAANGLDRPILAARLFRSAAATAGARGETAAAIADFSRSSADFSIAMPGSRPIAETDLLQAAEEQRSGQADNALALCRKAAALLRELKAGTSAGLIDPCLAVYEAAAQRLPKQRQGLLAEMFDASQLAQGGVTSQQIALASARLSANASDPKVGAAIRQRQDAGAELAELYRQRDALTQPQAAPQPGAPAAPAPTKEAIAELDKKVAAAQAAVADADASLQAAAPNYGQLVQQVAPASDVLAALRPGESFASIVLDAGGGWTFLLRDGQVSVARISDGQDKMAELVRRVRAGIEPTGSGVPRFDIAAAQQVYAALFGGLDGPLQGTRALVVAPAGPLLSLPFEVLLTGAADDTHLADAPWLVKRVVISHVPAAANFVSLRKVAGTSRATRPWFGFGDFRPVTLAQAARTYSGAGCAQSAQLFSELPPLPFAHRELDAARALLGGGAGDEMLGQAFTAAAVEHAALTDYRILHFATHALLPTDLACQSEPAIVTSDPPGAPDAAGALLTASDVTGLHLDADVVILSACNSGGPGGSTAGESLSGLARAFFYAGARALVVTHWSVSDQAAAFLVADTLRRLHSGEEPGIAGALRAAQLGVLAGAGHDLPAEIAHPFFWAPFAVIGDGSGSGPTTAALPATGSAQAHLAGL